MTVDAPASIARMRSERVQRITSHMREPLHRNGYALVASTFSTSLLGGVYWAIAAHEYDTSTVGRNFSLIAIMMFLTNLASLNFTDVLNRFVPVAGPRTRRLVDISYVIAIVLGGLSAVVFVFGRNVWTPKLDSLLHGSPMMIFFIVSVMIWVVFVLQDAVLVGLRRATYVLVENTSFGVAKIILLIAFASVAPARGIFLSWSVPLIAVVVVVSALLFGALIPRHQRDYTGAVETIDRHRVGRFLGADYVASVASTSATSLMPLIVLAANGADNAAYVGLTWTVAYSLYLVSRNIGMALTTEGSIDPENLPQYTRAALTASARIVVPLSIAVAFAAPWWLHIFGDKYATHAVGLMRFFALSAIPAIVPLTVASVARVQRHLKRLVVVSVVSTLPVLVLIPLFVHLMGLAGAGLAWLVVQSAVALALMTDELRHTWRPGVRPGMAPSSPAPVPIFETEAPIVEAPAARASRLPGWWPAVPLGVATVLWLVSLAQIDTTTLGRFGLVSQLPATYIAGIAIAAGGFVYALHRGASAWLLAAFGGLILLMLHATPAITYSELRYAWAWKHVGVIDMLQHKHALTGGTAVLDIYRHWPGFFAAATALVDATGVKSALSFAGWGPPFFAILDAALLTVALRSLTTDRRRIALAVWFFMIANWVGQEYFAPQAFGFALYLAIIAIVLRWYQSPSPMAERFRARDAAAPQIEIALARSTAPQRRTVAIVLLVLMMATTTSHPLTPIVACLSLAALRVFRVLDRRWPLVAMASTTVVWLLTGAWSYTHKNLTGLVDQVGRLGSNVNSNLASFGNLSPAQHVVANMGRMVVAVMALLAVAGFVRRVRFGYVDRAAAVLCIAPALLLAAGAYGGEAIFRAYLFALPFAAFLAAAIFYPSKAVRPTWGTPVAIAVVTGALIIGTAFAYYGKDAWSDFTPGEVRAAKLVYDRAPVNSLIVDGTLAYPVQFERVDQFTYVTLGTEPRKEVTDILNDPAKALYTWMTDTRYAQGYVILTRSQMAEADETGVFPKGALERVERALLASPKFKVLYHDSDALVVTVPR